MPQVELVEYLRELDRYSQSLALAVPQRDPAVRAWREAIRYCDHTDGRGQSITQRVGSSGQQCAACHRWGDHGALSKAAA